MKIINPEAKITSTIIRNKKFEISIEFVCDELTSKDIVKVIADNNDLKNVFYSIYIPYADYKYFNYDSKWFTVIKPFLDDTYSGYAFEDIRYLYWKELMEYHEEFFFNVMKSTKEDNEYIKSLFLPNSIVTIVIVTLDIDGLYKFCTNMSILSKHYKQLVEPILSEIKIIKDRQV